MFTFPGMFTNSKCEVCVFGGGSAKPLTVARPHQSHYVRKNGELRNEFMNRRTKKKIVKASIPNWGDPNCLKAQPGIPGRAGKSGSGFTVYFAWSKENPGKFDWPGCSLNPALINVQVFVLFYFLRLYISQNWNLGEEERAVKIMTTERSYFHCSCWENMQPS